MTTTETRPTKRMHCYGRCKVQGIFDADKHGAPLWDCRCCGNLVPFNKRERAKWDATINQPKEI